MQSRDRRIDIAALNDLIAKIENPELRAQIQEAADKALKHKQFGLVFEEHLPECTPLYDVPVRKGKLVSLKTGKVSETYKVLEIQGDKVDCIYIDPPYNTGAKDWKYNNDYVDGTDEYRHSKWLSFIKKRLEIAKRLLNPQDSVLIVTIDEKEYLHLGCLLEEMFPEANSQMLSVVISQNGSTRQNEFSRVNEFIFVLRFGKMVVNRINDNMLSEAGKGVISRTWYTFSRTMSPRKGTPKQF